MPLHCRAPFVARLAPCMRACPLHRHGCLCGPDLHPACCCHAAAAPRGCSCGQICTPARMLLPCCRRTVRQLVQPNLHPVCLPACCTARLLVWSNVHPCTHAAAMLPPHCAAARAAALLISWSSCTLPVPSAVAVVHGQTFKNMGPQCAPCTTLHCAPALLTRFAAARPPAYLLLTRPGLPPPFPKHQ